MTPGTFIRVPYHGVSSQIAYVIAAKKRRPDQLIVRCFKASAQRWNASTCAINERLVIEREVPIAQLPAGITYPPDSPRSGETVRHQIHV